MAVVSTLAETFTLTSQGLGDPSNLPAIQVKRAVHEAAALYMADLIQSDQNQVIKCSASIPFENNQWIYSLAAITDMTMPDWVEIQVGSTDADWTLASVVNRDSLSMFRDRSELACAFYSRLTNDVLVNTVEFSYTPWAIGSEDNNFRIWYDPWITVNTNEGQPTGFPPQFNYLLATVAKIKLIPILIQLTVAEAKEEKTDKDILSAQIKSWNTFLELCVSERIEWDKKWKHYSLGSRANQSGRKKRFMSEQYL